MGIVKGTAAALIGWRPHHHRARQRVQHFIVHPHGRHTHVTKFSDEEAALRQHLETDFEPFDVYIGGTPSYLAA